MPGRKYCAPSCSRPSTQPTALMIPIYLGYGLCGKAVVGLVAKHSFLVVMKVDDCIGILLGSVQARREQLAIEAGTYFLSPGWVGAETGSVFSEHERMVEKYGRARADKMLALMMRNYKRLVYIRMPHATTVEADREYARDKATRFHMEYAELEGTPRLLQRMIDRQWDEEFIVAPPGQPITLEQFLAARTP